MNSYVNKFISWCIWILNSYVYEFINMNLWIHGFCLLISYMNQYNLWFFEFGVQSITKVPDIVILWGFALLNSNVLIFVFEFQVWGTKVPDVITSDHMNLEPWHSIKQFKYHLFTLGHCARVHKKIGTNLYMGTWKSISLCGSRTRWPGFGL